MARIAAEVDAGELDRRIGAEGPRDEVRTLAESFDHMLDRLEDAFARQRGFVSDASHELRTPLTAIRGQLEVLASEPEPITGSGCARPSETVNREIDRMGRLVDDLLVLARVDEEERPGDRRRSRWRLSWRSWSPWPSRRPGHEGRADRGARAARSGRPRPDSPR